MSISIENFDEIITKGADFYHRLTTVRCPFLNGYVHFNSDGFEHIKFKTRNRPRPKQDQYMRLKLLYLAPMVIKNSHTLQGVWETKNFERIRIHGRTDTILKDVTYYEFIAIFEKVRVKVIVKSLSPNSYFFWSIIPYWGYNRTTSKRKLHGGIPEED